MNSFKILRTRIHRCAAENIPKLALTMIIMSFISYIILSLSVAMLGSILSFGAVSPIIWIAAFLLSFASAVLDNILLYGFFVMVHLMYRRERAVLGHLLSGFRDFPRALKTALFFIVIYMAFIFGAGFGVYVAGAGFFSSERIDVLFIILVGVSLCVFIFLYFRFAFVWFVLYEYPNLTVMQVLRKNFALMKKKHFDVFLLCMQSGGLYLLFALVAFILPLAFGHSDAAGAAVSILRILSTFFLYIGVIHISISFAAAYEAVKNPDKEVPPAIENTAAVSDKDKKSDAEGGDIEPGDTDL